MGPSKGVAISRVRVPPGLGCRASNAKGLLLPLLLLPIGYYFYDYLDYIAGCSMFKIHLASLRELNGETCRHSWKSDLKP